MLGERTVITLTMVIAELTVVTEKVMIGELIVITVTMVIGGAYCSYCDGGDMGSLLLLL